MNQDSNNTKKTSLLCKVEKVVFHNEENGYSVLSVTSDGESKPFSICGILNGAPQGTMLCCEGKWIEHARFGRQFQVDSWEEKKMIQPSETAAIDLARFIAEKTNHNLFLTGKAGTGKTVFLKDFVEHTKKRVVVLAPTGISAINANAMTIHSFCRIGLAPSPLGRVCKDNDYVLDDEEEEMVRNVDMIIIDEVSMVRADVMDHISEKIRLIRCSDKPFGGIQLLLVGDLYQLSPVVRREDEAVLKDCYNGNYFFFNSNAIKNVGFETVCLDKVYRQDNLEFVNILNNARVGRSTWNDCNKLNALYQPDFADNEHMGYISLVAQKNQAEIKNNEMLGEVDGDSKTYFAEINDDFPDYCYPTSMMLILKKGAQVMFVKNDKEEKFRNGTLGVVDELGEEHIIVKVGDEAIKVEAVIWENIRYDYDKQTKKIQKTKVGTFKQFPLKLAWAITIHKSQGLTFDHAIIDIPRAFAAGLSYVALSRCRSLEGLVVKHKLTPNSFFVDPLVSSFYDGVDSSAHIAKLATAVGYSPFEWDENNKQRTEDYVEEKQQSTCPQEYKEAYEIASFQIYIYHETESKLDLEFWNIIHYLINHSGLNIYYRMKLEQTINQEIGDMIHRGLLM